MIADKKTVFLLGAGASVHLGYPLGFDLLKEMVTELHRHLERANTPGDNGTDLLPLDSLCETPRQLYNRLSWGGWSSPDEFLEQNPEFVAAGKFLIAHCLLKYESEIRLATNGGWYETLRRQVGASDVESFCQNSVAIVTFNYDISIDTMLHRYVQHRYHLDSVAAWDLLQDVIPIVHVHGSLGSCSESQYGDGRSPFDASQSIQIVSQAEAGSLEFRNASKLLRDAERIVTIGFGFGDLNVERLNFFSETNLAGKDVYVAMGPRVSDSHSRRICDHLSQFGLATDVVHFEDSRRFFRRVDVFS